MAWDHKTHYTRMLPMLILEIEKMRAVELANANLGLEPTTKGQNQAQAVLRIHSEALCMQWTAIQAQTICIVASDIFNGRCDRQKTREISGIGVLPTIGWGLPPCSRRY